VPPRPDLTITYATVSRVTNPTSCNGSRICLIVTVANRGAVDVTGLQDGCGTYDFQPAVFASFTLSGAVPAGKSVSFRSGFDLLEPKAPTTFTLVCEVDAQKAITESDETNNSYSKTVTLN
jgi:hypothetical protein